MARIFLLIEIAGIHKLDAKNKYFTDKFLLFIEYWY